MAKLSESQVFNNQKVFVEGWYWALKSCELKRGKVVGIQFLGRSLAVFRGASGKAYAVDAFCPHMGAHFQEGRVEGEGIRCAFHDWKFASDGRCVEIPCQKYADQTQLIPPLTTYAVSELYGLIWIRTRSETVTLPESEWDPLPHFADFGPGAEMEFLVGARTHRPCRPEVVMLNAIDAHHFNSVHPEASKLAGGMNLRAHSLHSKAIRLENQSPVPTQHWIGRLLSPYYKKGILNYYLDYWYASTGVVTLGPDFLNFYLLFPHRPTLEGGTQGTMVFITRKRKGIFGKLFSRSIVWITYLVGSYFEKGDREIFDSIQFSMKAPVKADHPALYQDDSD